MNTKNRILAGILCLVSAGYIQAAELPVPKAEAEKALVVTPVREPEVNKELWPKFVKMINAGNSEGIEALLKTGANPNCCLQEGGVFPIFNWLVRFGKGNLTPDQESSLNAIFGLLKVNGVDLINSRDPLGRSLIGACMLETPSKRRYMVIKKLLKDGVQLKSYSGFEEENILTEQVYTQPLARLFTYYDCAIPTCWTAEYATKERNYIAACRSGCEVLKKLRDPKDNEELMPLLFPPLRTMVVEFLIGEKGVDADLKFLEESMEAETKEKESSKEL